MYAYTNIYIHVHTHMITCDTKAVTTTAQLAGTTNASGTMPDRPSVSRTMAVQPAMSIDGCLRLTSTYTKDPRSVLAL